MLHGRICFTAPDLHNEDDRADHQQDCVSLGDAWFLFKVRTIRCGRNRASIYSLLTGRSLRNYTCEIETARVVEWCGKMTGRWHIHRDLLAKYEPLPVKSVHEVISEMRKRLGKAKDL